MLRVIIEGAVGEGKTTIGNIIENALREAGYRTKHHMEGGVTRGRFGSSGGQWVVIEERQTHA